MRSEWKSGNRSTLTVMSVKSPANECSAPVAPIRDSSKPLQLLSELLFPTASTALPQSEVQDSCIEYPAHTIELAAGFDQSSLTDLKSLATSNHTVVRCFTPLLQIYSDCGFSEAAMPVSAALDEEENRIRHALSFLSEISSELEEFGCPIMVIKSLDHWPDLGSDLDLYTDSSPARLIEAMKERFNATVANRSWGDRLANKWNFVVPGLPELVEVHVGRLGQTGEQTAVTRSLWTRSQRIQIQDLEFRVPAPEDRIVISTLQRMYRHFYIRLCDIADNAKLLDQHLVDFDYLEALSSAAGLWDGVATYLSIVSQYVSGYRGRGLDLPQNVTQAAKFGADQVRYRKTFLRVPIIPHSIALYAKELRKLLQNGEIHNGLRLSLLPGLATAAALEQKLTGSDKGIW
jgi:hypothetical protein